nr:Spermine synthase family protein [uncultured bacterium]
MNPMTTRTPAAGGDFRLIALFFALGGFSQIAQALLLREFLVVFQGNELSLSAFYGGWLFWIGCGAFLASLQPAFVGARPNPALIAALMPLVLAGQITGLRLVPRIAALGTGEFLSMGSLLIAALLFTLPLSLLLGLIFPMACQRLTAPHRVASLYILEALGALAGGIGFVFWLADAQNSFTTLGMTTLVTGGAAYAAAPAHAPRTRILALGIALAGLLLWLTPVGPHLADTLEKKRFAGILPGMELVMAMENRHGHTALATRGSQFAIVRDGRIGDTFPNPAAIAQEAAFFRAEADAPRTILLFGGVTSGLAAELLADEALESLIVIEEDAAAFDRITPYLPRESQKALADPRMALRFSDGRAFINRNAHLPPLDLILIATGDPSTARANRHFTREFYARLDHFLSPKGVLCTRVSAASNYLGREVAGYSSAIFHTLASVFAKVVVAPGDRHTFCASREGGPASDDPAELIRRNRRITLAAQRQPDALFAQIFPAPATAQTRKELAERGGEINSDRHPVTYFLNLVLWGKFTASGIAEGINLLRPMGIWPWLAPLMALAGMWMITPPPGAQASREGQLSWIKNRTRLGGALALGALGWIAMALQMMILLIFQTRVGHLFGEVALLNGLFMAGLALGALAADRLRAGKGGAGLRGGLGAVILLSGMAGLTLDDLLAVSANLESGEAASLFWLAALAIGLLTGAGFPLALALTGEGAPQPERAGGVALAADHFGGALGGLLAGGVLIPLLGFAGCGRLVFGIALLALIPLLPPLTWPNFRSLSARRATGHSTHAFAARMLWFGVLTVLLWGLIARINAPGPVTTFDPSMLSDSSGGQRFERREKPFPHHLGWGPEGATVSLATQPVAESVHGYAGPLNLLLSVNEQGVIKGVRHLHSKESPSYIQGIDSWLATLTGRDLTRGSLKLGDGLDGLSGATVTSKAALKSINISAGRALDAAFGIKLPGEASGDGLSAPFVPVEAAVALFLWVLAIWVHFRQGERARFGVLILSLVVLGIGLNAHLTELDLFHLAMGQSPSFEGRPAWWILMPGVILVTLALGPFYCGMLCPFGAAQEIFAHLGARLKLRLRAHAAIESRARWVKYPLLAAAFSAAWLTSDPGWLSFDPMQGLFAARLDGWLWGLCGVIGIGSLLFFRFWCRHLCPMGALLGLANRIALLEHFARRRSFNRCDLGAKHPFDPECLRCNRCLDPHATTAGREHPAAPRLLALLLIASLALIAGHLAGVAGAPDHPGGGWRRIDSKAVQSRIDSKRLSDREALWYRSVP